MTRFLLDTHVLLWAWISPEKLSRRVRQLIEEPNNGRLVSAVCAYEIANKFRLGKLDVEANLIRHYSSHLKNFQAEELAITSQHALEASSFSSHHRDPFDRLLAGQSAFEQVPLLTCDPAFQDFPIQVIW